MKVAAEKQRIAHRFAEDGGAQSLGKELAVHVGKGREFLVEPGLTFRCRSIEHFKEMLELLTEIGAIGPGLGADEAGESFRAKDAVILGKESEEDANEEALQLVAGEAAALQLVVELAHAVVGFFVRRVFGFIANAGLPEHEGEVPDVLRKVLKGKVVLLDLATGKEREIGLILGFQIVKDELPEVRDENVTRNLVPTIFAGEVFDVGEGLRSGEAQFFAPTLVFDDQFAFPEKIDTRSIAMEIADVFLKRGERSSAKAKDLKEVVPKGLLMAALGSGVLVVWIASETHGAVANFVPGEMRHRWK